MGIREAFNVSDGGKANGPAMVFAHGFGCDQTMWRHVAPHFEDRYRVIQFDYVGSGRARAPYDPERYASLTGYADDVVRILRELGLTRVVFVGHSVSAMIGVLAEIQAPDLFAAHVMVGPSPCYLNDADYRGGFDPDDIDGLLDSLASNYLGWSASMAPAIMGNPDRPELGRELEASFCTVDPDIAERFARATFLSDNRDDLARVSAPSLVLQCREDVIAAPQVGAYVADHLPDASLVVLDATGHCPHLSAPEAVVDAIDTFLAVRG
ncbi:alpha/beta fold hydrolase [uncultured Phycicoccus sp.]|uniref:alpha/beta fold hydrolase n=1 Tax=uncultured Phycicoccus sp. TaxID=661422 RepID=UPI0026316228|nr:alpha/beta hydrolase [uncultured Phycicoccus sp.]